MFGKNGDKWFTALFSGVFLLAGVTFTCIAIGLVLNCTSEALFIMATMGLMGVLFIAIGGTFLFIQIRKKRIAKKIRAEGRRLNAVVTGVSLDSSVTMNGRNPFVVNCQYTDGMVIHTFKSGHIWYDPSSVIGPGTEISVYVNPNNYNEYCVDTDSLLAAIQVVNH